MPMCSIVYRCTTRNPRRYTPECICGAVDGCIDQMFLWVLDSYFIQTSIVTLECHIALAQNVIHNAPYA